MSRGRKFFKSLSAVCLAHHTRHVAHTRPLVAELKMQMGIPPAIFVTVSHPSNDVTAANRLPNGLPLYGFFT